MHAISDEQGQQLAAEWVERTERYEQMLEILKQRYTIKDRIRPQDIWDETPGIFAEAWIKYATEGLPYAYKSYMDTFIYRKWVDMMRNEWKRAAVDVHAVPYAVPESPNIDYDAFSPDARHIIDLVLETPPQLMQVITNKGGHPANYRSSIRAWLADNGWKRARIHNAFEELLGVFRGESETAAVSA